LKRRLGNPRNGWENSAEMPHKGIGCEYLLFYLAEDMVQWRVLVDAVIKLSDSIPLQRNIGGLSEHVKVGDKVGQPNHISV
jgi:hypothetical protein